MSLKSFVHGAVTSQFTAKYFLSPQYPLSAVINMVFLNMGYEEDPPMAVPLEASDEPDRLQHPALSPHGDPGRTSPENGYWKSAADTAVERHTLMRTLNPASYTGLDLNPSRHEILPKKAPTCLAWISYVAMPRTCPSQMSPSTPLINIEAGAHYSRFPRFLAEVARVLRPRGHFLYADVRMRDQIAEWEEALSNSPMRLVSERLISENVACGVEKNAPRLKALNNRFFASAFGRQEFLGLRPRPEKQVTSYRMYHFAKD